MQGRIVSMTVGLIWAQSPSGVIGRAGGIPWHLPEDQARFSYLRVHLRRLSRRSFAAEAEMGLPFLPRIGEFSRRAALV